MHPTLQNDLADLYKWSLLNNQCKEIIDELIQRWESLLINSNKEEELHDFLRWHSNFLLCPNPLKFICISKLRLGSDYIIDFAIPKEGFSEGLTWELIEIETPHSPPFTKAGNPSARLTGAIQQIYDWKRWLIDNRNEALRIFPALGLRTKVKPNFSFTIIIGTRENSELFLEKRNQYAKELNIRIRSFDSIADPLKNYLPLFKDCAFIPSAQADNLSVRELNQLTNPFGAAFTDKDWRMFLNDNGYGATHFFTHSCQSLLRYRPLNEELFNKFKALHDLTL